MPRTVPLKGYPEDRLHDQLSLLNVARIAAQGMDIAEMVRRQAIVKKLMVDRHGKDLGSRSFDEIDYLKSVTLPEAEWSELCRLFAAFRNWAQVDDRVIDLRDRLNEAKQIEEKPEKKGRT